MLNLIPWMKKISAVFFAGILVSGCTPRQAPTSPQGGLELTVLHVNDTHSYAAGCDAYGNAIFSEEGSHGGLSRIAMTVRQAKAQHDNVLALDAGDQFQGTLYYSVNKWPMLADIDQHMPYDAMTLENHEFDEGCLELSKFIEKLPFPVLAANLAPEKGCPLSKNRIYPSIIRTIRGAKVGIIGLANSESSLSSACDRTRFKDTLKTLQENISELDKQGVQHIVVLTHLGLPTDKMLARSIEGIDVIVGGHTHNYLGPDSEEGPYPIVETSPSGHPVLVVTAKRATQYLGKLTVVFNKEGVPVSWSGLPQKLLPGDSTDPAVSALVQKYTDTLDAFRNHVVGYQNINIPDGMDACRQEECLGGMITTDAMLDYARPYGADIALCNGGAIRSGFPQGKITQGDLLSMHPFGNRMVLRQYTGKQILEALEHGASGEKAQGPRLLQVAGLRYMLDASRPAGSRIVSVELLDESGRYYPLDLKASYGVILPDFLAKGGDRYSMLKNAANLPAPEPMDRDLLEQYLRKHTPLPTPVSGRVIRLNEASASVLKTGSCPSQ